MTLGSFMPVAKSLLVAGQTSVAGNNVLYYHPMDPIGTFSNATEANVDYTIRFPIRITRLQVLVPTNTKDQASTVAFRDDGATVASVSIAAGTTTDVDSGALNVVIAAGSKINFLRDTSASGSGNLAINMFAEYEVIAG